MLRTCMCVFRALRNAAFIGLLLAPVHAGETYNGWRGNGTGLWPDAKPRRPYRRAA